MWHPRFFFTRLRCQLQFRKLYGYRILNAQYVLFMGKKVKVSRTHAQNSHLVTIATEYTSSKGIVCPPSSSMGSKGELPLWRQFEGGFRRGLVL
jgi:hypothetical protein